MSPMTAPVIASQGGRSYLAPMGRHLLRLLTMIAVLMVPFGTAAAPASPSAGHASMAMPVEHCPEGGPSQDLGGAPADCAMPCSSALPAGDVATVKSDSILQAAAEPRLERALAGILLEIATPPPKFA